MNRKIYLALAMILIGVFLLLKNFDLVYFNWRFLFYILALIWGMDFITRYIKTKQPGNLFLGLAIFGNALWLIGANIYWNYVAIEELGSVIILIIAASLVLTAVFSGNFLVIIAAVPLIIFAVLMLNNLYIWYPEIYISNFVNAGIGTGLISLGTYYMVTKKTTRTEKKESGEPSSDMRL